MAKLYYKHTSKSKITETGRYHNLRFIWLLAVVELVGWLVGFLTSSSATRLYHARVPKLTSDNFTPTQPVGSGRTQDLLTRSRALYRLSYRAPLAVVDRILKRSLVMVVWISSSIVTLSNWLLKTMHCPKITMVSSNILKI